MSSTLAHSAARGAFFTLAAQVAKIVLQFLSVIVLARLLTPHDYGLLAIVLVVVGVGEIFRDFGLTTASIQAPVLTRGQRDNLFWINSAIGVVLTIVMFFLAWPIEAVTDEPEIVGMVHWLSLLFLLNGLATQHRANLARDLKFKAMAVIEVVGRRHRARRRGRVGTAGCGVLGARGPAADERGRGAGGVGDRGTVAAPLVLPTRLGPGADRLRVEHRRHQPARVRRFADRHDHRRAEVRHQSRSVSTTARSSW